jgi:hypothetical protein
MKRGKRFPVLRGKVEKRSTLIKARRKVTENKCTKILL